ncbi:MAG: response regulator [SAR324 cluster bacterium]|nr:response regulator [SAR324 cluster bacterium]
MKTQKNPIKNNRIIVIDDDPGIRETYLSILSDPKNREVLSKGAALFDDNPAPVQPVQDQFEVTLTGQGEKGIAEIEAAVREDRKFAVAFIDMKMPGLDGAQTAKKIWGIDQDVKIIFVTAFSEHSPDDINLITGRNDSFYLRKPFNPEEIRQFARALTNEWSLERERERLSEDLKFLNEELESINQNLNEQVEQQTAMLIQTEKMASIGILATGVADEIQTPVSGISQGLTRMKEMVSGISEIMRAHESLMQQADSNTPAKVQEQIQKISDLKKHYQIENSLATFTSSIDKGLAETKKIQKIIKDLKSFSKEDETEYRYADINRLIDASLYVIYDESKHNIEIDKRYDETLPQIKCFPQKLSQVFINLLINAAQAIKDKGKITIKTEQIQHQRQLGVSKVRITFSDDGCGIPADKQNKVFDPFYTTKSVQTGTGLGLSISYDIIKVHGGRISVKSAPGEGTHFIIILPLEINIM